MRCVPGPDTLAPVSRSHNTLHTWYMEGTWNYKGFQPDFILKIMEALPWKINSLVDTHTKSNYLMTYITKFTMEHVSTVHPPTFNIGVEMRATDFIDGGSRRPNIHRYKYLELNRLYELWTLAFMCQNNELEAIRMVKWKVQTATLDNSLESLADWLCSL